MEIQSPYIVSVNDNSETGLRELHLVFKPDFQALELVDRLSTLKNYIDLLNKDMEAEADEKNQQGMLTIIQISEELYPHLESDEIPLDETIVVDIGPSQLSPFDNLLRDATL